MNDVLLFIAASPLLVLAVAVVIAMVAGPPDHLSDDETIILARSREASRG